MRSLQLNQGPLDGRGRDRCCCSDEHGGGGCEHLGVGVGAGCEVELSVLGAPNVGAGL
jgi:hypothetical protein